MIGSFFATLLLFAPPVVLLGMVAPFAIRLALVDVASAGQVAGRLYALSTVGQPARDVRARARHDSADRDAADAARHGRAARRGRSDAARAALAASRRRRSRLLVLFRRASVKASDGEVLYEVESPYQFVQVVERGRCATAVPERGRRGALALAARHGADRRGVGHVRRGAAAARAPGAGVAVLGNAGGTIARAFGAFWPHAEIDGVEIDPAVSEARPAVPRARRQPAPARVTTPTRVRSCAGPTPGTT